MSLATCSSRSAGNGHSSLYSAGDKPPPCGSLCGGREAGYRRYRSGGLVPPLSVAGARPGATGRTRTDVGETMPSRRLEQLGDQIRDELSDLMRRELRDPGLTGIVSITEVELTADLKYARAFVSALGGEEERQNAVAALTRAAGFLRRELGKRLHIRHIPELLFLPDESLERGDRILGLIREIGRERDAAPVPEATTTDPDADPAGDS